MKSIIPVDLTFLRGRPFADSGRTPPYRLEAFFQEKDTELLLGEKVEPGNNAPLNA